ncbi:MAG TPA: riboflavin biosynthesis protein RibF [Deltaproteobacteria bacterium]|nr:riboflavin biosynthesis protein RibF [Deltaproteobacteria bacterium]
MKVFRTLDFQEQFRNPVLTIGNYDGIHIGHRKIIELVKRKAAEMDGTSILMTFHPHPLQMLQPDRELPSITPLDRKIELIEETGIDVLIIVPFTEEFGFVEADDFIKGILVDRLKIKGLVIGYDFRFGRGGRGDTSMLKEHGSRYGFKVHVVERVAIDHEKVGSNKIRILVRNGNVAEACHLLGRPYSLGGQVVSGMSRGREIGFPTVNLKTDHNLVPANGVYITQLEYHNEKHPSVTNIGYNPTFGNAERTIETHILDFQGLLYGCAITLHFLRRIRDEVKFGSVKELVRRITADVDEARAFFQSRDKGC